VKLYLPRAKEAGAAPVPALAMPEVAPTRGGETILVVEDESDVRKLAVSQLADLGYRVIEAANGVEARKILATDEPIDLLFTDVVMPGGVSGRALADEAKRLRPKLATLFTSGYTENSIVHHGRLDANVQFLAKPYRRQELARKVREAINAAK
jgi:CheY-like chemotaxis protein